MARLSLHSSQLLAAAAAALLGLFAAGCSDSKLPPTNVVRDAFTGSLPAPPTIENFEVDAPSDGEKKARVRYRASVKPTEALFAPFQGDPAEILPEVTELVGILRETETGVINPFARPFLGHEKPMTPARQRHLRLVQEFKTISSDFIIKTADPKPSIPLDATAFAVYEFGKWRIEGWSTGPQTNALGPPCSFYPAGAVDILSDQTKDTVSRLLISAKKVQEEAEDSQEKQDANK